MKLTFKGFEWKGSADSVAKRVTGGDKGLLFLANEARRLMDPYVPAGDLVLAKNTRVYAKDGHGIVEYTSPYAHFQYEGVGPTSGKPFEYSTFKHPQATSKWDQAMIVARGDDLEKAYQDYIERGAK